MASDPQSPGMEEKKPKKLIFSKHKLCARHRVGCFACFERLEGRTLTRMEGGREGCEGKDPSLIFRFTPRTWSSPRPKRFRLDLSKFCSVENVGC